MNKVILMGRLTRDPEVHYTGGGSSIAKYTLAVDRRFKSEGGPTADFPGIVCFGKTAEFCEKYLKKGTKVFLRGRLVVKAYTDKNNQPQCSVNMYANEVNLCGAKTEGNAQPTNNVVVPSAPTPTPGEDDLPF